MSATVSDTITAIATPSGRGGVGIVRISGNQVKLIAKEIIGQPLKPRYAHYCPFRDKDQTAIDYGIALYFPAPHSFTGEDVLELQGHGGQVVLDMLLKRCLTLGARMARPGEFSERAYLNDKIDLAQAEAIVDLIDSHSEQAARSALRSLRGEFSQAIEVLRQELVNLRVYVEAALDFPDEEVDFLEADEVTQRLQRVNTLLTELFSKARQGSLLQEGMSLVLAGQPNAGKSSLLNALAGKEAAIVTEVAGTTRDVLHEHINLKGMPLHIIDTAGLRQSDDPIEKIGIERAWQAIEQADLIIFMVDDTIGLNEIDESLLSQFPKKIPVLTVFNKIDLSRGQIQRDNGITLSVKQGHGLDQLKQQLQQQMGYQEGMENVFIARRRHLQALENCQNAVNKAEHCLLVLKAGELMAEELRIGQEYLGEITGKFTSDDLLGEIFSSFCIGK